MATSNAIVSIATTLTGATGLQTYASDAAFVTAKGSAAADGDIYYNTTTDTFRGYVNGAWEGLNGADSVVTADITNSAVTVSKLANDAVLDPSWLSNIGLVAATTTNANDSIKIQGATAALSSTNILTITMGSDVTAGLSEALTATADVTINLTGAHWGLGGNGDFTDVDLCVYAINDGSLKWGVSNSANLISVTNTSTSTTATNINLQSEVLVNSSITAGTWPCRLVGHFKANFDDTGGAAEDLWAVQTGAGDIVIGIPPVKTTNFVSFTPTGSWVTAATYTGYWRRVGDMMEVFTNIALSGGTTSASLTVNLPSGYLVDAAKLPGSPSGANTVLGQGSGNDTGNNNYPMWVVYSSTSAVGVRILSEGGTYVHQGTAVSESVPVGWGSGDSVGIRYSVPILGWSA